MGKDWSFKSYWRFLNARLKLVLIHWKKKKKGIPAFLASVWQLHEQICEENRKDHWGFPPLTLANKFCQESCLLHTDEKPGILIIISADN